MVLTYAKKTAAKKCDVLIPSDTQAQTVAEKTETVLKLAAQYQITIVNAWQDGIPSLVNCIKKQQVEILPPSPSTGNLEYFKNMALRHFSKIKTKRKEKIREKYFKAWAFDMKTIMNVAGIKQTQFLNSIL